MFVTRGGDNKEKDFCRINRVDMKPGGMVRDFLTEKNGGGCKK